MALQIEFPHDEVRARYGLRPTQVKFLGTNGGFSGATFWRFCDCDAGTLCLRRWPAGTSAARLLAIHTQIVQPRVAGLPFIAAPRLAVDGQSTFFPIRERWGEVQTWLPGEPDLSGQPSTARVTNAFRALAQLHAGLVPNGAIPDGTIPDGSVHGNARASVPDKAGATSNEGATRNEGTVGQVSEARQDDSSDFVPSIAARRDRLHQWQSGKLEALTRRLHRSPALAPIATRIIQQAKTRLGPSRVLLDECDRPMRLQSCLRDVRTEHLLFLGAEVTGIIDYDAMRLDSPAADFARLAPSLFGYTESQWNAAIAGYRSVAPFSEQEIRLAKRLSVVNPLLAALQWLDWIFVAEVRFPDMRQVEQRIEGLAALVDASVHFALD